MSNTDKPVGVPVTFEGEVRYEPQDPSLGARRRMQPEKVLRWVDRVAAIRRGETIGPVSVHLHLQNACQHKCPFCSPGEYRAANPGGVPRGVVLQFMEQARELDVKNILLIGGGEPTLNPAIADVCVQARRYEQQLTLTTNGGLICGKQPWMAAVRDSIKDGTIKAVRVSLDAFDKATHDDIHTRGKDSEWYQLLNNIEWMLANRHETTSISIGILIYDSMEVIAKRAGVNREDYKKVYVLGCLRDWYKRGVRMVQVRPVYEFKNQARIDAAWESWSSLFSELEAEFPRETSIVASYSSHQQDGVSKPRHWKKCHMTNLQTSLGATGEAFVCCALNISYGKWYEGDVCKWKDLWLSAGRRVIESSIDPLKPGCASCTMAAFNGILDHESDFASEIL